MVKLFAFLLLKLALSMGFHPSLEQVALEIPASPADPVAAKALDDLLARWEKRSNEIQSVQAEFHRKDVSKLFNTEKTYEGQYAAKGMNLALMNIKEKDQKGEWKMDEQLLLTTENIYQFKWATHQTFITPHSTRNDRESLKALDAKNVGFWEKLRAAIWDYASLLRPDSPLLLLKVRANDLKAKYRVDLLPESKGRHLLRLVPKTEFGRSEFSRILVALNKETLQPEAIRVSSEGGDDTKTFFFKKITVNPALSDELFRPASLEGWTVVEVFPSPKVEVFPSPKADPPVPEGVK